VAAQVRARTTPRVLEHPFYAHLYPLPLVARCSCVFLPWQELRKTIVSCIMATDMSLHFDLVDETKKCVAKGDYTFEDVNDQVPMRGAVRARPQLLCLSVLPPADAMLRVVSHLLWPLALSQRCVTRRSSCASCWSTRPTYPTPCDPSR